MIGLDAKAGPDGMHMKIGTSLSIIGFAAGLMAIFWTAPARAESQSFDIALSGAGCKPPVETTGTGKAALTYDPATQTLAWDITYGGLPSPATQAHIHAPAADGGKAIVLTWLSQPGSAPENPIKGEAKLTAEQAQQFAAGKWWVNLHTQSHPACEIRGDAAPPKG